MFRNLYDRLASLTFGLWLIGGVMVVLAAGSFSRGGGESGNINDMPLFIWLAETPVAASWWLWLAIVLIALLVINTILCSIDSVRSKFRITRFPVLIAPQIMHAGFLLIVLAHLLSAWGGYKQVMPVYEGGVIALPDGTALEVSNLAAAIGPMGFPTDYSVELRSVRGPRQLAQKIRPNQPFFYEGAGFYLKEISLESRAVLIEVHREPGAGMALAGAILFTVGNVVLLYVRRGRRSTPPRPD